jgi:hypothetical protein
MPATVIIDNLDGRFSFTDEQGAATSFQRTLLITGLTISNSTPLASLINEARTAVNNAGFAIGDTSSVDSNLRVVKHDFEPAGDSSNKAMRCVVTYAAFADSLPGVNVWVPTLSGSVNQIQTSKDEFGFPIFVQHTYDNNDPNYPGQTITQGASVNQFRGVAEITYRGLVQPPSILLLIAKYLGKVNSTTWNYGAPLQWLCTNFTASLHDKSTTPDTWLCEVTFQADGSLWSQDAVFIDPTTGKPPADLVSGVGIKTIYTQQWVDFNDLIPAN